MLFFDRKCPNCQNYYDSTLEQCPHCHKDNELYAQRDVSTNIVYFHPLAQAGLFLGGFAYAGMLICELLGFLIYNVTGINDSDIKRTLILFFTYLLMVGGLLSIALFTRRQTFLKRFTRPIDYAWASAYVGIMVAASLALTVIISMFHVSDVNANQSAAESIVYNYPILSFFVLVILGPISEEMTYRVGLYSLLRRRTKYIAIIVTSLVFTLIHIDFGAADIVTELWSIPSYLVSGVILTIAYEHRGPACSITAHLVYNLIAFLAIIMRG